ncbi:MAG: 16S rRNA (guanine(966)-N(2))-methyltransferase RsmD [Heliobacteriaceae bacterium]|jgi:16S rRNA (guanine966-N2)-methyltransferase|nr:16S rRNA (guanine(966)-N(2))-methyltransferase RsmD [Heliobacteriaceae bacterium]
MIITAGNLKGQKVIAPDESRPTLSKVRMGVFNTLQSLTDFNGKTFLDMYAGSGIMGLEALSRGFSKAVFIEDNPQVIKVLKTNLSTFQPLSPSTLLTGDSLKTAPKLGEFDVIYIDPPYFSGIYEQSLQAVKSIAGNIVILEHVNEVNYAGYKLIKRKKYGNKLITFLTK